MFKKKDKEQAEQRSDWKASPMWILIVCILTIIVAYCVKELFQCHCKTTHECQISTHITSIEEIDTINGDSYQSNRITVK